MKFWPDSLPYRTPTTPNWFRSPVRISLGFAHYISKISIILDSCKDPPPPCFSQNTWLYFSTAKHPPCVFEIVTPGGYISEPQTAQNMQLVITPELGTPLPLDLTPEEVEQFRERAQAACRTIQDLIAAGGEVDVTQEDSQRAHQIMTSDSPIRVAKTPPGTILKLESLLTQYDHEFLGANRRIANFVTNRLLEETEDEDARVRLKALELLGKRRGVNLFTEQMEITIKQKPTEELEGQLSSLLEKYMGVAEVVEHKALVDLDAELGPIDAEEPVEPESPRDTEDEPNAPESTA